MAPPPTVNHATGLAAPAAIDSNTVAEHHLLLQADEPLVVSTPFLQWQAFPPSAPGGPPLMGIPHPRAVKAFLRGCSLSTAAADLAGMAAVDCFVFFLTAAAWQRLLDELCHRMALSVSSVHQFPP